MRKIILVVVIVALSASCKKSYNCTCTKTTAPTGIVTTTSIGIDDTWQNAEWACHYRSSTAVGSQTVTCLIQ